MPPTRPSGTSSGHQNSTPAARKVRCSRTWIGSFRSVASYRNGRCQVASTRLKTTLAASGQRLRLACSGVIGSALDALLDDWLGEQPEARHRVADHGRDPWPLGTPALAFGARHAPQVAVGQYHGRDVHADDQDDLEVPHDGG